MKVTDYDPEDSVRPGPPQRLFCRSRRALQNTLWVRVAITFPWEVIREIKICIKLKNRFFPALLKLKFEGEDSVRSGPPRRHFCRAHQSLQNTLWDNLASTFPWKVIRKIKICIILKICIFSILILKFEGEVSVWDGRAQRESCSPGPDWLKSLWD